MTILDYIRQLPGMEKIDAEQAGCLLDYGLDKHTEECPRDDLGFLDCGKCMDVEATINGEPAPYLFPCPVKPGQTVYVITTEGKIEESIVYSVEFTDDDETCPGYEWVANLTDYGWDVGTDSWLTFVFPTREEAEAKLAEMRGKADGK